jgi:hypothetical protein
VVIFTLVHFTSIQIGFGLESYKAGVVPWTEASLGLPVDFNLNMCEDISIADDFDV